MAASYLDNLDIHVHHQQFVRRLSNTESYQIIHSLCIFFC